MKQYWERLTPKQQQFTWVGSILAFIFVVMYMVMPESEHVSIQRTEKPVQHLLTSKDSRSLTLQSMSAKLDSLKTNNAKLTRALDTALADIRLLQKENAPTRMIQKELSEIRAKLNQNGRQMATMADRVDSVQDSTLEITSEVVDQVVTELKDHDFGMSSPDNGYIPIAPAMTQVLDPSSKPPVTGAPKPTPKPTVAINTTPSQSDVQIYDNAENFFKQASIPASATPNDSGSYVSGPKGKNVSRPLLIRTVTSNDPSSGIAQESRRVIKEREEEVPEDPTQSGDIKLPAGTHFEAVILSGMDAPTNKAARNSPYPSLLRIKKEAILPSRYRADIRECFLIASGYGDMSSERAYMRGETLSCITAEGKVIESRLDSFAVGEDSKAGIRGRLVTKNGALIANSLLAGFGSGLSSALDVSVVPTVSNQSSDTVDFQRVLSEQALQKGAVGGAKNALEQISQYYLDMAENITPVIEIDAGRVVTFIANRGVTLKTK